MFVARNAMSARIARTTRDSTVRTAIRSMASQAAPTVSFINGKHVPVRSDRDRFDNINPATGQVINQVQCANDDDLNEAVAAAKAGGEKWARTPGMVRHRVLMKASEILRARVDEIAAVEVEDNGKPLSEARYVDIYSAADCIEYMAGVAPTLTGKFYDNMLDGERGDDKDRYSFAYTKREPVGVCAGIGAWNYPIQIAGWKSAPALACGNSMVFKPSEQTPRTAVLLAEAYSEAGLPDGVFNVVQGAGQLGAAMCAHKDVSKLSFTGEVGTGQKVMAAGIPTLKKVTLELGGKSPCIIFDDANLEQAVSGSLLGNFYTQGEICTNGTRVFVHENVYDAFVARLLEKQKCFRLGDPMDMTTNIGPLVSEDHMQLVLSYIEKGKAEGGTVLFGGRRASLPGVHAGGYYVEPTAFVDLHDDMTIVREEIFGPVMSILKFKTEEEVVARANDTDLGLAAGVFTNDLTRAHRMVARLKAGVCWVNHYNPAPVELPFGGYKMSGVGRENSTEVIAHYTQLKTVFVETDGRCEDPFVPL